MPRSLSVILALFGVILGLADSSARAVELAQSPQMGQIIDAAPMIFAGDWQGDDHAAVRLLAVDNGAEGAGGIHALNPIKLSEAQKWLGLEFRLAAGWHIYGRDPGDAGLPPIMQFLTAPESKLLNKLLNKSENKSAATAPPGQAKRTDNSSELGFTSRILWPQDKKLEILGILSRGYDQSVILPILLTDLSPKTAQISLQNRPIYYADVTYAACAEICVPYHAILTLDRRAAHARLENTPFTQVAELWTTSLNRVASAELAAALKNIAYNYPPISLQNQDAQAATGDKNAAVPTQAASAHDVSLVMAVFLAFLGGVILNFMPCVLPVISLKLMGFARLAESDVTRERNLAQNPLQRPRLSLARIEMGAIFIGIVVSFLLLGLVLAGLKLGGVAAGWGMQFQQPIFLAVMTVILLVFSANLLGLFTIPLPLGMNRIFTWVGFGIGSGYGQKIERRRSKIWLKAMGTGILSTLLATPCSAPLVGTALTYALSRQTSEILSIFTAMGVGFAAFYGLAFLVPGLGKFMPKPGAWTVRLRQILGVIMLLSAVWMGYLWISALMPSQTSQNPNDTTAQLSTNTLIWQEFTPQKLANLQAQHRVIMVDVTARWCLTCKANEVLVLNTSKTYELLTKAHVALLRADWTHPNPMIADYLAQNHRYGIPFNAIYRPNSGKTQGATPPILLPEILTFDALQQAVTAAQ